MPNCLTSCQFKDDGDFYYCVGTAMLQPDEEESSTGYIYVVAVRDRKLEVVAELRVPVRIPSFAQKKFNSRILNSPTLPFSSSSAFAYHLPQGAVYSLRSFNGMLLATVNSSVLLYEWTLNDSQMRCLSQGACCPLCGVRFVGLDAF
jgi:DNA damage-binding protein 1